MKYPKLNPLYTGIKLALKPWLYGGVTAITLASVPVFAQDDDVDTDTSAETSTEVVEARDSTAAKEEEQIVVTGSRIRTDGMNSPNPVMVITKDELNLINPTSTIDALAELPQFNGSYTQENFGNAFTNNFFSSPGSGTLSLRGLQGKRTLTLLDGKRIVATSLFGGPDASMFPN